MADQGEDIQIVDLRDHGNRTSGWIKGSINMPAVDRQNNYAKLSEEKIVLPDMYGKQAYLAARFLAMQRDADLDRLDGGFVGGWIKAGYAFEQ